MTIIKHHRTAAVAIDRKNREKDDFYATPPEATRALLTVESFAGPIWECACGQGHMSEELINGGNEVVSTDLVNRDYGQYGIDFLMEWQLLAPNIVTNPPYKLATKWMKHALSLKPRKLALFLKLACLEGGERQKIYLDNPPSRVWVMSKRVSLLKGGKAFDSGIFGTAWFVWDEQCKEKTILGWL